MGAQESAASLPKMSYAYTPTFTKFPKTYVPPEKHGEGDWIDPKERLAPNCLGHCSGWMNEYMACVARISARVDGKGDCNGQFMVCHVPGPLHRQGLVQL